MTITNEPDLSGREAILATKECEADLEKARNIVVEEDEHWFEEYFVKNCAETVNKGNFYDLYEGWVEQLTLEDAKRILALRPETSEQATEREERELLAKCEPMDMSGACGTNDR